MDATGMQAPADKQVLQMACANVIFSLVQARRDHISLQDLECFLPADRAKEALTVLDIDGDGKISLADMRDAVVAIYHERTNLASTLKVIWRVTIRLMDLFGMCNQRNSLYKLWNAPARWPDVWLQCIVMKR